MFSLALYLTVNALFFNDSTIHALYKNKGSSIFIYQIPKILYSSIISFAFNALIKFFSLTEKNILNAKQIKINIKENFKKLLKCFVVKFILFYIFVFLFFMIFWYYLSCFGVIFKNSQMQLIKDTLISFGISLLYPLALYLIPGCCRLPSLKGKKKKREGLYNISKIIQLL